MHLLFLSNFYPPYHNGGYEELCDDVAGGLRQRGHTVAILTGMRGVTQPVLDSSRQVYRYLHPEVNSNGNRANIEYFVGRRHRLHENLTHFQTLLDQSCPDIIMVWGMWNLHRELLALAESVSSLQVVYYIADYWPALPDAYTLHWQTPARRGYMALPKRLLGSIALKQLAHQPAPPHLAFTHAICVSKAVRDGLVQIAPGLADAQVIYNGIDIDCFGGMADMHAHRVPGDSLALLFAGRITPEKGVHTAIEAVKQVAASGHKVTLSIVGDGPSEYVSRLHGLAADLGISEQVHFLGRVKRDDMPSTLARFDVLVIPSTWPDPLPRIAQEGMACGLAVVAARVGGLPEIVIDGMTGLTHAPGDASSLAACIQRLIKEPALRDRVGKAGQQLVKEKFNLHRMVDEVEHYLQCTVQNKP